MHATPRSDAYSPNEIALAAGVPLDRVLAAVGERRQVPYAEALTIGQAVTAVVGANPDVHLEGPLFSIYSPPPARSLPQQVFLIASGSLHVATIALVALLFTFAGSRPAATASADAEHSDVARLVFLSSPGPGGGGGGGGRLTRAPAPRALRAGDETIGNPLHVRPPSKPREPVRHPTEPQPLEAELLPVVVAPIITAPADASTRLGVLASIGSEAESPGRGRLGGVGSGVGTGAGEGDGSGVGPGSGGGVGGGPYRGGSGIEPPRLVQEVKADYSEEARQRNLTGDVVLEIVVRRDGSVGDIRLIKGLGHGLDERAIQAVRQWRFMPALRLGSPVDVVVEVAVDFKLR